MEQNYEYNIHLKANGDPDVEYYILEAKRMRYEMISGLLRNIARWLKKQLKTGTVTPLRNAFSD